MSDKSHSSAMSDYKLGRKIVPPNPDPEPDWQRIKGTDFEVNRKGQKRTVIRANEQANMPPPPYGWPNWAGPVIGSTPASPVADNDYPAICFFTE